MKNNTFTRILGIFAAILLTFAAFTTMIACGNEKSAGKIGNFQVEIKDFTIDREDSDNPVLIVTYTFTNNSSKAEDFFADIKATVYQNGVGLEEVYFYSVENDNEMTKIKPGTTIDIDIPYNLKDTTSDIEIELCHFDTGEGKFTKTFKIAE